ncbi:hypothetical protein V2I68_07610 [Pseudomonas viridiflava]|uniref:ANTAR domain-containing protein n=1 Tax=Pseudomonas viridiflava TaxID=33069 RepID=A0ABU7N7P6_PSEVI|nr:hypothetical protein [Pseudomonas viridiflava]MEE4040536.1 hypothetical protein [Pseudomonas viridiflava]MEE4060812.1 hypothetical protein [Pseudomonas viridiflava]MEE4170389.1 hypothetical protein [Pseudomonas viridiflava]
MQAQLQSSSEAKAITPARHLLATAEIGAALIGYQIHKTPDARGRLEQLANLAHTQGDLTASDVLLIAQVLARPTVSN